MTLQCDPTSSRLVLKDLEWNYGSSTHGDLPPGWSRQFLPWLSSCVLVSAVGMLSRNQDPSPRVLWSGQFYKTSSSLWSLLGALRLSSIFPLGIQYMLNMFLLFLTSTRVDTGGYVKVNLVLIHLHSYLHPEIYPVPIRLNRVL